VFALPRYTAARGYRTIVVSTAYLNRVQISHHVSLIDIDPFLGDVVAARDSVLRGESATPLRHHENRIIDL